MKTYTLTLNLAGSETGGVFDAPTREQAIREAKAAFERVLEKEAPRPALAYCAVFGGEEPLGLWDYDPEANSPEPLAWEPHQD